MQQRDVVRTATLDLQVKDVDHAADEIVHIAQAASGRIDGDNRETSNNQRTADIVAHHLHWMR